LIQENFTSAARAYNQAIDKSLNDLIVFAHQDMVFPKSWLSDLESAISILDKDDPHWGVLGCYGVTVDGEGRGYVYSFDIHGAPFNRPAPVQTLDEIVLIFRKSSGLRFNESIPHFHLYGADICLSAQKQGMGCYAISAFCVHNAQQSFIHPPEFYKCYWHFKRIWKESLPVQTTCIRVTRFNLPMFRRRLNEAYLRYIAGKHYGSKRLESVEHVLQRFDNPQK